MLTGGTRAASLASAGQVGGAHHSGKQAVGGGVATPVLLSSKSGINWACAKPSITVPRYHAVSSRIRREGVQWQMT